VTPPLAGAADFASMKQILDAIPADALPASPEQWRGTHIRKFGDAFREKFEGKFLKAQVKIARVAAVSGTCTLLKSESVPAGGLIFWLDISLKPTDPQPADLAVGQLCLVTGRVYGWSYGSGGLGLSIKDCSVTKLD
jgi:hypothetical protein